MHNWYNLQGENISIEAWCDLLKENPKYCIVEQTDLSNGYWVSTVLLGLNHEYDPNMPPLIFETMVFSKNDGQVNFSELYMMRYSTLEQAKEGHKKMIKRWQKRKSLSQS